MKLVSRWSVGRSVGLCTQQQVQRNHLLHSVKDASLPGLLAIQLPGTGLAAAARRAARLPGTAATDAGRQKENKMNSTIRKPRSDRQPKSDF